MSLCCGSLLCVLLQAFPRVCSSNCQLYTTRSRRVPREPSHLLLHSGDVVSTNFLGEKTLTPQQLLHACC